MKRGEIKWFILWYTQFVDTCVISEYELLDEVNSRFHLSYQLNRFQDVYIDKMKEYFKKYKGDDGYWIYERIDIIPDGDWTLELNERFYDSFIEMRNREKKKELYDFLFYLNYAQRHNDHEFEQYIKDEMLAELLRKEMEED